MMRRRSIWRSCSRNAKTSLRLTIGSWRCKLGEFRLTRFRRWPKHPPPAIFTTKLRQDKKRWPKSLKQSCITRYIYLKPRTFTSTILICTILTPKSWKFSRTYSKKTSETCLFSTRVPSIQLLAVKLTTLAQ